MVDVIVVSTYPVFDTNWVLYNLCLIVHMIYNVSYSQLSAMCRPVTINEKPSIVWCCTWVWITKLQTLGFFSHVSDAPT
jgi:hypothetical protein